jgi:5-methyltetrahydrofolate--homocysteine methyltransferase
VPELLQRLEQGPCLLLDGGMGTMLMEAGLAGGVAPERLNLERPELVEQVHRRYVEAGSEALHGNSFGANPIRLAAFGLADRCAEINRRAVEIARAAGSRFVLGDMGPSGEYLPPVGKADPEEWRESFKIQADALIEAGVDGIHVETMGDLREAEAALDAVRSLAPELPLLVSLTFDRKKRGFFTLMGDPLLPSLERLLAAGATVVGANCSIDSGDMRDLAAEAIASIDGRLVFQANAGAPQLIDGRLNYEQTPEEFVRDMGESLAAANLAAIGGCCGTDPGFIAALAALRNVSGP